MQCICFDIVEALENQNDKTVFRKVMGMITQSNQMNVNISSNERIIDYQLFRYKLSMLEIIDKMSQ